MRVKLWEGEVEQVRYAQLFSRGVASELRLNDIPVVTAEAGKMVTAGIPVRQFTVPGQNVLSLVVGDWRAAPAPGGWPGLAQVTARIADFEEGAQLDEDKGIERAVLRPVFDEKTPNPLTVGAPFESRIGGEWQWTQAPVLNPDQVRPQLDALMARIHAAFVARDMGPLIPLFEPAIRDRVAAYPVLSIDGQIRMTMARFATANPRFWEVEPLDLSRALYRPAAGGRMIEALDMDGRPLVRSKPLPPEDSEGEPRVIDFRNLIGVWNGKLAFLT